MRILPFIALLVFAFSIAPPAFAKKEAAPKTVAPDGHEAILASVENPDPASYTINVRKLTNLGVDEEAPTFAVYIRNRLPETCGDFRELELPYQKPEKYLRRFDLSKHEAVLRALDEYGCVVMKNIPSQ